MKYKKAQRGISAFGLMMLAVLIAFGGLVGLKLFPVYMESMKIDNALKGVIEDPDISSQSRKDIRLSISKRLDIDGITRIHYNNFPEYGEITKEGDNVTINITYRAETPLFGNLALVADFNKNVKN
jgi:hypothetical protein